MLGDGIKQTTSTTGTTTALVLASVSGYPQISDFFSDGDVVAYNLMDGSTPPQLEWGLGTWSSSAGTLTRSYVAQTESSGTVSKGSGVTPLNLVGTTTIVITPFSGVQTPGRRATVATGMVSGNPHLIEAFSSGDTNMQGSSATANRIYLTEYQHRSPRAIKGFRIYSGTASGNVNFALYKLNIDGTIGKQVCTTGSKAVVSGLSSYALTTPIWLPPDSYVCVVQLDNGTASFRAAYGFGTSFFGPDASGNAISFMTCDPGSFTLPSPSWSGSLTPTSGGAGGPLVYMELV